jgi:hypothetical protein
MRVAVRRIEGFAKQFGEAHRNLARHAAFPLVLTPDLLYQIWANFVPEAPWTAVAHVLLSRLCRQVGYEMYEMDISDRNLLLRELKEQFGQKRLDELGEFLLDYLAQRLNGDDSDTQDLAQAQEWTALVYTKPDEAARKLAKALRLSLLRVQQQDRGEILRLASLVETFAEPLQEAGFEPLLTYASAINNFARGDLEEAGNQIVNLPEQRSLLRIAGVILPIPAQILIDTDEAQEQMAISGETVQRLSQLLTQIIRDEDQCRVYLNLALGINVHLLTRLRWHTPMAVLIPSMVQEMVYLGEIEPGKPALFALLELIRKNVGLNVRSDIDELLLIDTDETQEQMEISLGPVHCVAFSPDGQTLVSGSADTTIKIWHIDS